MDNALIERSQISESAITGHTFFPGLAMSMLDEAHPLRSRELRSEVLERIWHARDSREVLGALVGTLEHVAAINFAVPA